MLLPELPISIFSPSLSFLFSFPPPPLSSLPTNLWKRKVFCPRSLPFFLSASILSGLCHSFKFKFPQATNINLSFSGLTSRKSAHWLHRFQCFSKNKDWHFWPLRTSNNHRNKKWFLSITSSFVSPPWFLLAVLMGTTTCTAVAILQPGKTTMGLRPQLPMELAPLQLPLRYTLSLLLRQIPSL